MKPQRNLCRVLVVGFIVLFFWCVGLYWINAVCNEFVSVFLPHNIQIQEPKELKVGIPDKEHYRPGSLYCSLPDLYTDGLQQSLFRVLSAPQEQNFLNLYKNQSCSVSFVYDNTHRQILIRQIEIINHQKNQSFIGYIGPKGYSSTPNPGLGTFGSLLSMRPFFNHKNNISAFHFFLYDLSVRRFYRVDMKAEQSRDDAHRNFFAIAMDSINITEGPVLNQADWRPAQITQHFAGSMTSSWIPPAMVIRKFHPAVAEQYPGINPQTMPDSSDTYIDNIPISGAPQSRWLINDMFVLHDNGRIDYVDGDTLSPVRCAGYLPQVGFYPHSKSRHLFDLGGYGVETFYDPNDIYLGMIAAAASRDGMTMQMDFYDALGNVSKLESLKRYNFSDCSLYTLAGYPAGTVYLAARYVLENLQSPLLRLLDMPAAGWVEPQSRNNTLFVHPNSLVGLMKFEYKQFGFWLLLPGLMLPSLAISLWLGFKARQKAVSLGYDQLSRDAWLIAVLAFGIPAYITFRLTEPKQRMVTCANCGNLRRVEFEVCQSCKRDWQKTRDLTTAPDWRVTDTTK